MNQRKPGGDTPASPHAEAEGGKMPPDLDPLEREMFEGLLQSLAAAGREIDDEENAADLASPKDNEKPPAGEPSLEDLEALEDELAGELEDDIDEEELASLLSGAADAGAAPSPSRDTNAAVTSGEEALLAKLLGSFADEAGLAPPPPDPAPETTGPKTPAQLIYLALERALAKLLDKELLDLPAAKREDLLEQLLPPVLAASSLDAALRVALEGLVDSELVEEVYGDDDELLGILRGAFDSVHREATQES